MQAWITRYTCEHIRFCRTGKRCCQRGVSGLVLIAKDSRVASAMTVLFQKSAVEQVYRAVTILQGGPYHRD